MLSVVHSMQNNILKKNALIAKADDITRLSYIEKEKLPFENHYAVSNAHSLTQYIYDYRAVEKGVLFALDFFPEGLTSFNTKYSRTKLVSKLYSRRKQYYILNVNSSFQYDIASQSQAESSKEMGILSNGTLEEIDSPDESLKKLRSNIEQYSLHCNYTPDIRTPSNVYFHNNAETTQSHPLYKCTTLNAIDGHSANITVNKGTGYLLFFQKFPNGKYEYSLMLKGEKGATVSIIYDCYKNGKWIVNPLASLTIQNSSTIYQIKTFFEFNNLSNQDYFLVGATVTNGNAVLDNFCLRKMDINPQQ